MISQACSGIKGAVWQAERRALILACIRLAGVAAPTVAANPAATAAATATADRVKLDAGVIHDAAGADACCWC